MKKEAENLLHYYTFNPDWIQAFVEGIGAEFINNKLLLFPPEIASGAMCFLELAPGFSVLLGDLTFHKAIAFTRVARRDDMFVVYYDMSDEVSSHIVGGVDHKIGYQSALGMGVVDTSIESTYVPKLGERSYGLRLFVSKKLLKERIANNTITDMAGHILDETKNTLFYYSHIDSRSKVLLHRLKNRSFKDPVFEILLRGASFNLLSYLLERTAELTSIPLRLSESDIAGVMQTKEFLMENLLGDFVGVGELAKMAHMSVSKYKQVFKKIFGNSPYSFFLNEKLILAQHLLESGDFANVNEVAYEVGYSKPGYFAAMYRRKFGKLPGDVLTKQLAGTARYMECL
ncbi:MAG TPA: AraC family transcriptional regulator [Pseudosphingobacterium sp.]|nr:AraC family transcriptional regulator [Pseudosphingobacterium sp.]